MSRCYSHVFYGSFPSISSWYTAVFGKGKPAMLRDRVIGGWLKAFSLNQRQRWLGRLALTQHDDFDEESKMLSKIKSDVINILIERVKKKLPDHIVALFDENIQSVGASALFRPSRGLAHICF